MGIFIINKMSSGEFQSNLTEGNGQVILNSRGSSSKTNYENENEAHL